MRFVRHARLTPAPWKNGSGITREIASVSDDRGLLWRLSLAEIERHGPFSVFAGRDRILTIVAGGGLVLEMPERSQRLDRMLPFRFSGTTPVTAHLSADQVRALNLIYRPDDLTAAVHPLHGGTRWAIRVKPGEAVAIFTVSGGATLNGAELEPGDTVLDAAGDLDVPPGAEAVIISIAHRPAGPEEK